MLDRNYIIENDDLVAKNAEQKGVNCDVPMFVQMAKEAKELEQKLQTFSEQANALAKEKDISVEQRIKLGTGVKAQKQEYKEKIDKLNKMALPLQLDIPNIIHPDTPIGGEADSKEIARGKTTQTAHPFPINNHVELGEALGIFDFTTASTVSGAGFYYLLGDAVRLELALQNFALGRLTKLGFTPVITPELVHESVLTGAGYRSRGDESNSYKIEGTDLHLIATSEIPLCGMFANKIIDKPLPIRIAGISHCFRSERAAGRATRGLFRVHQFSKVEMLVIAPADDATAEKIHQELLDIERGIYDDLEIPYRVVDVASGDLGAPAYRKFDIEAWMPGRGEWSEVTSASNCTDYQARHLKIRYKDGASGKNTHPYILNGTAIAVGRTMIALMENHQQADGSVLIPKALQPFFGGDKMERNSTKEKNVR